MAFDDFKWRRERAEYNYDFSFKWEDETLTEKDRIILTLECIEKNIHPYSIDGNKGFKKYLKKAIKLIKGIKEI